METEGITLYNDTYVNKVYSWRDAKNILKEKGIIVESICKMPIFNTRTDRITGITSKEKINNIYGPVHFLNNDSEEIAYWSIIDNVLIILKEPRIWGTEYLGSADYFFDIAEAL